MKKLINLPNLPPELIKLIDAYNELPEPNPISRLYYLQKICYLIQTKKYMENHAVINWKNQSQTDWVVKTDDNNLKQPRKFLKKTAQIKPKMELHKQEGSTSLESHLQFYSIQSNASIFLQTLQFANAVAHYSKSETSLTLEADSTFYSAMRKLNQIFKKEASLDNKLEEHYVALNKEILEHYNKDPELQEKAERHAYYLGLCYGKLNAIQGLVQQKFKDYKTRILGNPKGNNKNYIFNIADDRAEPERVVIRVENRSSLEDEQELQSWEVSEYFTEDYATFMVPFKPAGSPDSENRPVVISEFVSKGDLSTYAFSLQGKTTIEIVAEAGNFFNQLNQFNLDLMKSKHYHPDLKLTNILTNGKKIKISDRKTLKNNPNPKAHTVESTYAYAPKEYRKCWTIGSDGEPTFNKQIAMGVTLNLPAYMAFQTGMALKEWIILSKVLPFETEKDFDEQLDTWEDFSKQVKNPPNALRNMAILIQELTRELPEDRLSIEDFQYLLTQKIPSSQPDQPAQDIIALPFEQFMAELESKHKKEKLSIINELSGFETLFHAKTVNPVMKELVHNPADFIRICNDPRINLSSLLKDEHLTQVKEYLNKVQELVLEKGLEEVSQLDPKTLPELQDLTKAYLFASSVNHPKELNEKDYEVLEQVVLLLNALKKPSLVSKKKYLKVESKKEAVTEMAGTTIVSSATTIVTPVAGTTIVTPDPAATTIITSEPAATTVIAPEPAATTVITPDLAATTIVTPDPAATTVVSKDSSENKAAPVVQKKEAVKPLFANAIFFEKKEKQTIEQPNRELKGIFATIEEGNKESTMDYFRESGFDSCLENMAQHAQKLKSTGKAEADAAATQLFKVIDEFKLLKTDFIEKFEMDDYDPEEFVKNCEKIVTEKLKVMNFEFLDNAAEKMPKKEHGNLIDKLLAALYKFLNSFKKHHPASEKRNTIKDSVQEMKQSINSLHFAFFGKEKKEETPKEKAEDKIIPKKNS